jgi:hypothetical protein
VKEFAGTLSFQAGARVVVEVMGDLSDVGGDMDWIALGNVGGGESFLDFILGALAAAVVLSKTGSLPRIWLHLDRKKRELVYFATAKRCWGLSIGWGHGTCRPHRTPQERQWNSMVFFGRLTSRIGHMHSRIPATPQPRSPVGPVVPFGSRLCRASENPVAGTFIINQSLVFPKDDAK